MTPHQDRQHHTHSIPEHSRNPYHTRNVMVISSTQNPHNSPCVLLRMHMQPRKMIQIGHSFRIYNPLILIHIPSVSHYHSFHQIISSHFSVELHSKISHKQLSLHISSFPSNSRCSCTISIHPSGRSMIMLWSSARNEWLASCLWYGLICMNRICGWLFVDGSCLHAQRSRKIERL